MSDPHFIGRRANALGIVEATSRQVADLQELRRLAGNATLTISRKSTKEGGRGKAVPTKVDVNSIVREGSRIIIDEISRVANKNESKPDSLGMAMCFAAVGEGLMKSRQPRDAMLRLEEAVGLYKELLGAYNTRVSRVAGLALFSCFVPLRVSGDTRKAIKCRRTSLTFCTSVYCICSLCRLPTRCKLRQGHW